MHVRPGRDGGAPAVLPPGATFSAQTVTLDGVASLEAYTEWMKGSLTPLPDGNAEVRSADYVYVMDFDADKIRHMTKIWNDGITLRQLGWA
jgi:hypothetical protein